MTESLVECVPNFSEGRDPAKIDQIVAAIESVPEILILHRTSDWDHHRSVITFAGPGEAVLEAAVRAAAKAAELIDLNEHSGVHPRVGALDVLPFVPLGATTLEDCVALARRAGQRISAELAIPVYFYGAAAIRPDRVALEDVRRGQFEGLREAPIANAGKAPDLAGPMLHPTAGAVIVGARKVLIAYNINLRSTDLDLARSIARRIRTSSGGFPAVKALGLPLPSRNLVQISMNLTDYEQTPLHIVYAEVERLAGERGVEIEESEVIGLLPQKAMEMAFAHFVKLPDFSRDRLIEHQIEPLRFRTIETFGPFLAEEKCC
ncbi:MAG: glutamate formimidoyltransferase [Acidobacteriota bacterium]|nr:glutamate formimidoyltransferase [Acidobacteriota bacterium]